MGRPTLAHQPLGVVPLAHSQDVTGPMARTVADAATVLGPMTGVDPRDPATADSRGHSFRDYRRFLDPDGLRGARIGVWREGVFGISPEADAVAEAAIAELSRLGATVVDPTDIPNVSDVVRPRVHRAAVRVQGRHRRLPVGAPQHLRCGPWPT